MTKQELLDCPREICLECKCGAITVECYTGGYRADENGNVVARNCWQLAIDTPFLPAMVACSIPLDEAERWEATSRTFDDGLRDYHKSWGLHYD